MKFNQSINYGAEQDTFEAESQASLSHQPGAFLVAFQYSFFRMHMPTVELQTGCVLN
jgi:hypothetical protein